LEKEDKPHFFFKYGFFSLLLLSVFVSYFLSSIFLKILKDYFTVFPFSVSSLSV